MKDGISAIKNGNLLGAVSSFASGVSTGSTALGAKSVARVADKVAAAATQEP